MPPSGKQDYCAFISYSHEDEPWARQLFQDLTTKKNIPPANLFKDDVTLRVGNDWRNDLTEAIAASRNLVVLWSSNATKRQWVNNELSDFDQQLKQSGQAEAEARKRMIFVLLDSDNEPYKHIQMIGNLKKEWEKEKQNGTEKNIYDPQDPAMSLTRLLKNNAKLWDDVVKNVYQAIYSDEVIIPVLRLILTTTSDRLTALDFTNPPEFADFPASLDQLLGVTQIGTREDLLARYDMSRANWRPIPGRDDTIETLLADLQDRINEISNAPRIEWQPVDEFWNDRETAEKVATTLANELSLIVIDPIALYDPLIYKRLALLEKSGCFDRENVAVLLLSPFAMSQPNRTFRDLMLQAALSIFDDYYKPGVRKIPYARCSFNFGDDMALTRPLLMALKQHLYQSNDQSSAIPLRMGGQRR